MSIEFCAATRFVQIKRGAVAITPDERVYLCANGRAVRLVPVIDDDLPDPAAPGVAPSSDEE